MIKDIKRVFGRLTLLEVATNELIEAELDWMKAESAKEFAASQADYNKARVKRLKTKISELLKEGSNDTP